jgi:hypothetical protein
MTPKDKALELYNKYEQLGRDFTRGVSMKEFAKQCALIAVDEILNEFPQGFKGNFEERRKEYWQEVKQEIEAL